MKGLVPAGLAALGVAAACSATNNTDNGLGASGGTGGSTASDASTGTGGSISTGGTGIIGVEAGGGGGGGLSDGSACTSELQKGTQAPLDMYVMLDISGSMDDTTGSGTSSPTKWDAVKQAFTNFLGDSQSAGLGVGIQYFPLLKSGVPSSCTTNNQCINSSGPCGFPAACQSSFNQAQLVPCSTNADCSAPGDRCLELGVCANAPAYVCYPINSATACGAGNGNCILQGTCINQDSCQVTDYSTPAVPIGTLPGVAAAIEQSLATESPNGDTPTGPALQGAISYAESWAQQNPSHKVIAVLATDGIPTECPVAPATTPDINQIAGYAAQGVQNGVDTFVIGVFGPNDTQSQANLNTIAKQGVPGGTGQAILVDTSQNVTQEFINALNQIRGTELSCDFEIPQPKDGGTLDYSKVNVQFTDASGNTQSLYYVGSQAQCDPTKGGWYYDVDPSKGTPTKIIVCDATCNTFKTTINATVNIALGCKTVVKPPS
jgi:hypothetical protein